MVCPITQGDHKNQDAQKKRISHKALLFLTVNSKPNFLDKRLTVEIHTYAVLEILSAFCICICIQDRSKHFTCCLTSSKHDFLGRHLNSFCLRRYTTLDHISLVLTFDMSIPLSRTFPNHETHRCQSQRFSELSAFRSVFHSKPTQSSDHTHLSCISCCTFLNHVLLSELISDDSHSHQLHILCFSVLMRIHANSIQKTTAGHWQCYLWSPYVIWHTIIFSSCFFLLFFFA